jgi:hypothetical protein
MKSRALQILAMAALPLGVFATGCSSRAQGNTESPQTAKNESKSLINVEGHSHEDD